MKTAEYWTEHTKKQPTLKVEDHVRIQNQIGNNPKKWDKTGIVIEVRQYDQYVIRVDGSGRVTLRNRRFLRRFEPMVSRRPTLQISLNHSKPTSQEPMTLQPTPPKTHEASPPPGTLQASSPPGTRGTSPPPGIDEASSPPRTPTAPPPPLHFYTPGPDRTLPSPSASTNHGPPTTREPPRRSTRTRRSPAYLSQYDLT